jgi:HK97 family phage major capsid protein
MRPELQGLNADQLRGVVEYLDDALRSMNAGPNGEIRSLTDTEQASFDDGLALRQEAHALLERHAQIAALPAASAVPGDGGTRADSPALHVRKDPFENLDGVRAGLVPVRDLVGRARQAVEEVRADHLTDESRSKVISTLEGDKRYAPGIAKHVLLTGSDAYQRAFEKVYSNPVAGNMMLEPDEAQAMRAALTLTNANGGYMVPFLLDPTIILTNNGSSNPWRQVATVKPVDVNVWHGVSSAGVTAEWIAEATEVADATPTFAQPTITAFKADAYIQGSYEVLADSGFAGDLALLLADAKDRLEEAAFATGTGSGQPNGVVTSLVAASKTVAAATNDTFAVADVYSLIQAVPPRHRSKAVWLANLAILNKIRQFDTAGGSSLWAQLAADRPPVLMGRPVYESSTMNGVITALASNYVLVAADMSQYTIVDRVGMTVLFEPIVKGTNRRPTGEGGWVAYWRTGGDFVNPNAGRVLNV